jgi:hypothetical protein
LIGKFIISGVSLSHNICISVEVEATIKPVVVLVVLTVNETVVFVI